MQRNYKSIQQPQDSQQEKKEWAPKPTMSKEDREREIEKSTENVTRNRALITPQIKSAWDSVLALAISGPECELCKGKGHTLFKCPSYQKIKGIKDGIEILRPVYNCLVATEMIRIHKGVLDGKIAEDQNNMD